jgi:His-Xaa-Ser system protein HxsD
MEYNTIIPNEDGTLKVLVDPSLYSPEAILATADVFTGAWYVKIDVVGDRGTTITFTPKTPPLMSQNVVNEFLNELIDQQLRLRLRQETADLHRLIVSEAFAPLDSSKEEK